MSRLNIRKPQIAILNSNVWFSAISDYSLQFAIFTKNSGYELLFSGENKNKILKTKCHEQGIPYEGQNWRTKNPFSLIKNIFHIVSILFKNRTSLKSVIVFEGPEHTLCCLTKIFFPFLWKNKFLIRIRGQAQKLKSNGFSFFMYKNLTNKVILASQSVKNYLPEKWPVVYYGKAMPHVNLPMKLAKDHLNFIILGRFDPIKGHQYFLETFCQMTFRKATSVFLIGRSENILAKNIKNFIHQEHTITPLDNVQGYKIELLHKSKTIFVIDENIKDLIPYLQQCAFAVIPSLGSEVICRVGVEFLAHGLPVLYSDAGALPEVFSAFPQFLFEAKDKKQLEEKLKEAEGLYYDRTDEYQKIQELCISEYNSRFTEKTYQNIFPLFDMDSNK